MSNTDWIKAVLPTVATAFGGPLAGVAANFIAGKLGLSESTVDAVKAAITGATPEQLTQLKAADQELQKYFADIGVKLEEVAAGDRASARQREATTGDTVTPRALAATIVGGFLFMVYLVLRGEVDGLKDPVIAGMVGTLIGYVSAKADQVVSYYFGSSASSKSKDNTINQYMNRK